MSLQIRVPETVGVWLAEPKTQRNRPSIVLQSVCTISNRDRLENALRSWIWNSLIMVIDPSRTLL